MRKPSWPTCHWIYLCRCIKITFPQRREMKSSWEREIKFSNWIIALNATFTVEDQSRPPTGGRQSAVRRVGKSREVSFTRLAVAAAAGEVTRTPTSRLRGAVMSRHMSIHNKRRRIYIGAFAFAGDTPRGLRWIVVSRCDTTRACRPAARPVPAHAWRTRGCGSRAQHDTTQVRESAISPSYFRWRSPDLHDATRSTLFETRGACLRWRSWRVTTKRVTLGIAHAGGIDGYRMYLRSLLRARGYRKIRKRIWNERPWKLATNHNSTEDEGNNFPAVSVILHLCSTCYNCSHIFSRICNLVFPTSTMIFRFALHLQFKRIAFSSLPPRILFSVIFKYL